MAFSALESVQSHKQRAFDYIVQHVGEQLDGCLANADLDTESPIEAVFMLWWEVFRILNVLRARELDLDTQMTTPEINGRIYRLDFSITPSDKDMWLAAHELGVRYRSIGIELDGHEFHERTKEQVITRNQRDRDLQAAGWRMLHFSGTELFRNPAGVVMEALAVGTQSLNELTTHAYQRRLHQQLSAQKGAEATAQDQKVAPAGDSGS